jgi:hypothetical protein
MEVTEVSGRLLRIVFDVAVRSADFGSGFLDDEEVTALREVAVILGADPADATPGKFLCKYRGHHKAELYLDTPFFTDPDGVPRNAYRRTDDYPEGIRGKLEHPAGGEHDVLGSLRARVIRLWCHDCGRQWGPFDDTSIGAAS